MSVEIPDIYPARIALRVCPSPRGRGQGIEGGPHRPAVDGASAAQRQLRAGGKESGERGERAFARPDVD